MTYARDSDGTPHPRLYAKRVHDRLIAEMLGLVKGVVCDGVITDGEAVALSQWLDNNPEAANSFPGSVIAERLRGFFADGILHEEEREHLLELLRSVVGEEDDQSSELNRSTTLPLDHPTPTIFFDNKSFTLTGRFASGVRAHVEAKIKARGGACGAAVTNHTDYLVIGLVGSPAWVQSTYGRKIEDAVSHRERGARIAIICEEDLLEAINSGA